MAQNPPLDDSQLQKRLRGDALSRRTAYDALFAEARSVYDTPLLEQWLKYSLSGVDSDTQKNLADELRLLFKKAPELANMLEVFCRHMWRKHQKTLEAQASDNRHYYDDTYLHSFGVTYRTMQAFGDPETPLHTDPLARSLVGLWIGATLHDAGKLSFPDDLHVTNLRGKPDHPYWDIIKNHPLISAELVAYLSDHIPAFTPYAEAAYAVALQHHGAVEESAFHYPDFVHGDRFSRTGQLVKLIDYGAGLDKSNWLGLSNGKKTLQNRWLQAKQVA